MPKPISDQVIVITGASSGIGLMTARDAARRGARVVLAARNENDLESAVHEIRSEGGEAIAVPTDVADLAQVEALAQRAIDEYGRIDTWVNNAAAAIYGTFREVPQEDFKRAVDVNFHGQVHGARAALPHLEKTAGALICVGSALSDRGLPLQGAYSASKHALKGWLDSLRVELRHEGSPVRVTLVKPSSINTPLFDKARTYMGVQPMPFPPVYEPELVAEGILRAAEGNLRDLFIGGSGKVLSLVERVSPRLVDAAQQRTAFKKQQTDLPKGRDAANNLEAPVAQDGGLRGKFAKNPKRRSPYHAMAVHPVVASWIGASAMTVGAALLRNRDDRTLSVLLGIGATMLAGKALLAIARDHALGETP